jgi:hypothetical protein
MTILYSNQASIMRYPVDGGKTMRYGQRQAWQSITSRSSPFIGQKTTVLRTTAENTKRDGDKGDGWHFGG